MEKNDKIVSFLSNNETIEQLRQLRFFLKKRKQDLLEEIILEYYNKQKQDGKLK